MALILFSIFMTHVFSSELSSALAGRITYTFAFRSANLAS